MVTDEYLEAVALGLFALDAPLLTPSVEAAWRRLQEDDRRRYVARARFVLSYADPTALGAGRG